VSLRGRLILLSALAVAVAVALASVIVYALVRHQLRDQIDDTLREQADAATVIIGGRRIAPGEAPPGAIGVGPPPGQLVPPPGAGSPRRTQALGPAPRRGASIQLPAPPEGSFIPAGQLIRADGSVVSVRGDEGLPVSDASRAVAARERGAFFADVSSPDGELRVYTVPAGPESALQVARPLQETNETLSDLRLILLAVFAGGVAVAAGLGLGVARGTLAPAAAVSGAAEEVARTRDLTRRIEVRGSDELARLAASFNEMMEALEGSEAARRRLVADASHELRTPLATIRTNVETLAREDLDESARGQIVSDLEAELEDMSGLVADVLELARDPEEPHLGTEEVRLDEVAAAVVERARRRARALPIESSLEPWLVRGDPSRLDRAIWNLLDNAIKWSPDGAGIEISLREGELRVRDHGPGFAEEDLAHAFDRFYRADDARGKPGSGLGLAIARRIATEHGGDARAANASGGGGEVTLELPGERPPGPLATS
jgi:two-component system, OmpR family, sensor histidine kinase MprB